MVQFHGANGAYASCVFPSSALNRVLCFCRWWEILEIKIIQFTFVQSAEKRRMLGKEEILGGVIFFFFAAVATAACGMFIYLYMYI